MTSTGIDIEGILEMEDKKSPPLYVADHYTTKMPQPPRINMPTPTMGDTEMLELQQARPLFLPSGIQYNPPEMPQMQHMWKYNDRHKAQQILPYLYLGALNATKNTQWMKEEEITFVVGITHTVAKAVEAALSRIADLGVKTAFVEATHGKQLIKTFPQTFKLISEHVTALLTFDQTPKVLVACESGNGKSAAIVIAFLVEAYDNSHFTAAIRAVQTIRFCAVVDEDDKHALSTYYDIICARRAIAASQAGGGRSGTKKRQMEEEPEEDDSDTERFKGRDYAPFDDCMDMN